MCFLWDQYWSSSLLWFLVNDFSCVPISADDDADSDDEAIITEEDLEEEDPNVAEYNAGNYSPKLFAPGDIDDIDAVIYDPVDDMKKLALARAQVKSTGRVRVSGKHV